MNVTTVSTGTSTRTTVNNKTYKIEMIEDVPMNDDDLDDDDDDPPSSPGSAYEDGQDLMQMTINDEVAMQLAAAGPVGVAAAAAIASSRKRKRPHSFETNPSIRKRQQNRLLRKLRTIIYEFTGRVGQQAIVLVATPGKPNTSYKVFGAKPLEDVVRNLKNIVMEELESALAQQAPPPPQEDPSLFELPPLIIDGIPTPVEKMTQAQLRAFIPLMLKYSTGRGKPGWGRESTRPPWWPKDLPWANVRMDARTEEDKQKISWTHALRKIVINCYKYHGREDLLPTFSDEEDKTNMLVQNAQSNAVTTTATTQANNNYTQTVLSTIQNADGTISLIQVDPNNPIITLPDGTTAQVQGVATLHQNESGSTIQTVQSLGDLNGHENMTVDLTEATLGQDGQIIITGDDGQSYPISIGNMITVPVSASMYQSMMSNIQQITPNGDGTVCITPMQVDSNNPNSSNSYTCYPIQSTAQQQTAAAVVPTTTVYQNGKLVRAIFPTTIRCQQIVNNTTINNNNNSSQSILVQQNDTKVFANNNNNNNSSSSNISENNNTIEIAPPVVSGGSGASSSSNSAISSRSSAKRRKQNLSAINDKKIDIISEITEVVKIESDADKSNGGGTSPLKVIKIEKNEK